MRPRKLNRKTSFENDTLAFNEPVKAAIAELRAAGRDKDKVDLSHLTAEERDFALSVAHLDDEVQLAAYCPAWLRSRQRFAKPDVNDYVDDLAVMVGQPEFLHGVLGRWALPPRKSTGPAAAHSGSQGVALVMAALGQSAHVDDAFHYLKGHSVTQALLSWALGEAAVAAGRPCVPFRLANSSDSVLRHLPELAATLGRLAMEANVRMLRTLAELYPELPICEVAGIDGTAVAAWYKQSGKLGESAKWRMRERTPQVGSRCYGYDRGGKRDLAEGEHFDPKKSKFWRGYYLVALADFCTGRPIVWMLRNAQWDEARALKELLNLLYELWPDCPLKTIVGDGAWDEDWAYRLCEVNYGLHLVASRSDDRRLCAEHHLKPYESSLIAKFNGRGEAFCRRHGNRLKLVTVEAPSRTGLAPGEEAPEAQFRLRFRCEDGCGTPSLQMRHHWPALAYYPHNPHGMPKRHAERHALLAHRNVCESLFNQLKAGGSLATVGADRLRLNDFRTVHALIDLNFCLGTALMLGYQRDQLGVGYSSPWAEAAA